MKMPRAVRPGANSWKLGPIGGWGAGQDPPSMLMFLHYVVSNNAAPLCAVPIHSPFFWSAVPTWARFREVTQRHEMTILGAPAAVFASAALLSPGITGFACTEKWYTSKRLAGLPTWECRDV